MATSDDHRSSPVAAGIDECPPRELNTAQTRNAVHLKVWHQIEGTEQHFPRRGHTRHLYPTARRPQRWGRVHSERSLPHERHVPPPTSDKVLSSATRSELPWMVIAAGFAPKNPKAAGGATVSTLVSERWAEK